MSSQNVFPIVVNIMSCRFVLMCTILDGDAPINIKWFKDGAELSNKNSIDIELSSAGELGSTLVFRRVHQSQTGNYTCLASNQAGQASFTSFMSVKGESILFPQFRSQFLPILSHSIQLILFCRAQKHNAFSIVTFIHEYISWIDHFYLTAASEWCC